MRTATYTIFTLCLLITISMAYVVRTPSLLSAGESSSHHQETMCDLATTSTHGVDRIILTLTNNPASSIVVQWRSRKTHNSQQSIQYLPTPESKINPQSAKNISPLHKKGLNNDFDHWQATLSPLTPETSYSYRVGSPNNWSEWFQFTTAADHNKPFSILFFGDVQEGIKDQWPRIYRNAWLSHPKASFMLFVGDLVDDPKKSSEWNSFFNSLSWLASSKPLTAVPGDHEYDAKILSSFWNAHFQFPNEGPEDSSNLSNTAYHFDYQGVRFIAVNTYAMRGLKLKETLQQRQWVKRLLENNPNQWTVVFQHEEPWSSALGKSDKEHLKYLFAPLYAEHGVDLVLQGDSHVYSRGQRPGNDNKKILPIYVSSNSGTKFRHAASSWSEKLGESLQLYQHITFDRNQIHLQAITTTGRVFDQFTIRTDSTGKSLL